MSTYTATISSDLEPLIPQYMDNRRKDIGLIQACLVEANIDKIREIGHMLKGSGGGYGFPEISAYGAAIETAAKVNDTTTIAAELAKLKDYVENVEITFVDEDE